MFYLFLNLLAIDQLFQKFFQLHFQSFPQVLIPSIKEDDKGQAGGHEVESVNVEKVWVFVDHRDGLHVVDLDGEKADDDRGSNVVDAG